MTLSLVRGGAAPVSRFRVPALPAWAPAAAFVALMLFFMIIGRPWLIRSTYSIVALLVGVWLFTKGPGPYLVFAWALWHVSPGIRRIVDYQMGGWDPANPMSLAPFLVAAVAGIGILQHLRQLGRRVLVPWAIVGLSIVYGYFVGLLEVGIMPATHALVAWTVPLIFGLYCALEWRRYPEIETAYARAFLGGSLVLAAYGILQFVDPPDWDRLWMVSSGMYSVGRAFPYEVRVFSLVNAPLPFATILVAGLFIALAERGFWRLVSLIVGTIALMLSLVRSVWLAGAAGFVVYLLTLPLRSLRRAMVGSAVTAAAVAAVPLLSPPHISEPTKQIVRERLATFSDLGRDVSFQDRTRFLSTIAEAVADHPLGHGLGSTGVSSTLGDVGEGIRDFDNGIFAVLYSLGWVAGAAFLLSVCWIVALGLRRHEGWEDGTVKAARAVTVMSLVLCLGANIFEGVSAAVLWGFAGLLAAGHRWHTGNPGVMEASRS